MRRTREWARERSMPKLWRCRGLWTWSDSNRTSQTSRMGAESPGLHGFCSIDDLLTGGLLQRELSRP